MKEENLGNTDRKTVYSYSQDLLYRPLTRCSQECQVQSGLCWDAGLEKDTATLAVYFCVETSIQRK